MNNQESLISVDKDEYFKTYFAKRKALHMNLIQQLISKSESKKELVMQQASQIIEKFMEYRDEFISNLPAQVRTMKVKDYMSKYDTSFQKCLKNLSNEEKGSNSILNEKFDIEPEVTAIDKKNDCEEISTFSKTLLDEANFDSNTFISQIKPTFEPFKAHENKENDHFEMISNDYSKDFSKTKQNFNGEPKSNRKRKKPQPDTALKENKNLLNMQPESHRTGFNAARIYNLIKESKALTNDKSFLTSTPTQTKVLSKLVAPSIPVQQQQQQQQQLQQQQIQATQGSSRKPWVP